jgi:hypothetical protein
MHVFFLEGFLHRLENACIGMGSGAERCNSLLDTPCRATKMLDANIDTSLAPLLQEGAIVKIIGAQRRHVVHWGVTSLQGASRAQGGACQRDLVQPRHHTAAQLLFFFFYRCLGGRARSSHSCRSATTDRSLSCNAAELKKLVSFQSWSQQAWALSQPWLVDLSWALFQPMGSWALFQPTGSCCTQSTSTTRRPQA